MKVQNETLRPSDLRYDSGLCFKWKHLQQKRVKMKIFLSCLLLDCTRKSFNDPLGPCSEDRKLGLHLQTVFCLTVQWMKARVGVGSLKY